MDVNRALNVAAYSGASPAATVGARRHNIKRPKQMIRLMLTCMLTFYKFRELQKLQFPEVPEVPEVRQRLEGGLIK